MRHISLGHNAVPAEGEQSIVDVFRSGQYSPGARVREFEEKFAALHQSQHAVFVNSGTDALRLSLLAMKEKRGWRDGDYVAVPALTFVATVNVIIQSGLRPFFVDVGMYDFTMNASNLQHRITCMAMPIEEAIGRGSGNVRPTLVGVMPVHLFGTSCSVDVFDVASKYKLAVIEDSCETILNPLRGDVSCHSTYMAHHLTTGVGGFATTDDEELNLLIRSYANHGRNVSYIPGYFNPDLGINLIKSRFRFDRIGYSSRGTEFEAALGLSQIPGLSSLIEKRRRIFLYMRDCLSGIDATFIDGTKSTCMMFPIILPQDSDIDKYDLCLHLEKNGIETRDMMPITTQPCYKSLELIEDDFSVAKWVNRNGFYIPCHPGMTEDDAAWIGEVFASYFRTAAI